MTTVTITRYAIDNKFWDDSRRRRRRPKVVPRAAAEFVRQLKSFFEKKKIPRNAGKKVFTLLNFADFTHFCTFLKLHLSAYKLQFKKLLQSTYNKTFDCKKHSREIKVLRKIRRNADKQLFTMLDFADFTHFYPFLKLHLSAYKL